MQMLKTRLENNGKLNEQNHVNHDLEVSKPITSTVPLRHIFQEALTQMPQQRTNYSVRIRMKLTIQLALAIKPTLKINLKLTNYKTNYKTNLIIIINYELTRNKFN